MLSTKYALAIDEVDITGLEKNTNTALGSKSFSDLASLFSQELLTFIFIIVGLLFFTNLVLAGWEYMTSSGDPKKVASASSRFVNGLMGIVISFTSYLIVKVVLAFLGLGSII